MTLSQDDMFNIVSHVPYEDIGKYRKYLSVQKYNYLKKIGKDRINNEAFDEMGDKLLNNIMNKINEFNKNLRNFAVTIITDEYVFGYVWFTEEALGKIIEMFSLGIKRFLLSDLTKFIIRINYNTFFEESHTIITISCDTL